MVLICDKPYQNNDFQPHFDLYPFPLSDFQKYAIQAIVEGNHTLVTAHTGSGKTLPAEFAIHHFNQKQKKIIYTSPIKALSNQKFHDFSLKFPHISFGLFTGDIKTNPDADVLIMTTEILMNYLFNLNQQTDNLNYNLKWTFITTSHASYLMKYTTSTTKIEDKYGKKQSCYFHHISKWSCYPPLLTIHKASPIGAKIYTQTPTKPYTYHPPTIALYPSPITHS